jgi:hypothetical protein
MIICGIEMASSEARLILLSGTKSSFVHINIQPRKIMLADDEDATEVRAFRDSLFTFLRENGVTRVLIKKRGKKGEFAGGAVGFKIEGILQLYDACSVELVSPQTMAAVQRKYSPISPSTVVQYQLAAFQAAFYGLQ